MRLYYYPGACSTATHIALRWTRARFEIEDVDFSPAKPADFCQLSPMGQVPVLCDGDVVVNQSAAIMMHLAEKFPEAHLFGEGTCQERVETMRWLMFGCADMHAAFAPLNTVMKVPTLAEAYEQPILMARMRLRKMFEIADDRLQHRNWLTGSRTVADAYLYVMMFWALIHRVDIDDLDNLSAFRLRMDQDHGVQEALRAEGLLPVSVAGAAA